MPDTPSVNAADVSHLIDLLDLLPDIHNPDEAEWWSPFVDRICKSWLPGVVWRTLRECVDVVSESVDTPEYASLVRNFADICLDYFGEAREPLAPMFDGLTAGSGARLLDDIRATAWRLYVPLEAARRRRAQVPAIVA